MEIFVNRIVKGRRGSAMVEAAIFFPIAVLVAMAVLYLMINLYSQASLQAHLHVTVRKEAAEEKENARVEIVDAYARDPYRREAETVSFDTAKSSRYGTEYIEASCEKRFFGGRLTDPNGFEMAYYGRSYAIDEAFRVRMGEVLHG
jgi:Flp pilus assembly protein TadG